MGRKTELINWYEIKIRKPGDRILTNGKRAEGGEILSKMVEANNPRHAGLMARGKGQILSIRKIHKDDVMGDLNSMGLQDIIGRPLKERRFDAINDNYSLDELVFGHRRKERER